MLCDVLVKAFNIVGNYTYSGQIFMAARRPYLIGHLITLTLQTNRITLMEVREGRQQNWCGYYNGNDVYGSVYKERSMCSP